MFRSVYKCVCLVLRFLFAHSTSLHLLTTLVQAATAGAHLLSLPWRQMQLSFDCSTDSQAAERFSWLPLPRLHTLKLSIAHSWKNAAHCQAALSTAIAWCTIQVLTLCLSVDTRSSGHQVFGFLAPLCQRLTRLQTFNLDMALPCEASLPPEAVQHLAANLQPNATMQTLRLRVQEAASESPRAVMESAPADARGALLPSLWRCFPQLTSLYMTDFYLDSTDCNSLARLDKLTELAIRTDFLDYNELSVPLRRLAPRLRSLRLERAPDDLLQWATQRAPVIDPAALHLSDAFAHLAVVEHLHLSHFPSVSRLLASMTAAAHEPPLLLPPHGGGTAKPWSSSFASVSLDQPPLDDAPTRRSIPLRSLTVQGTVEFEMNAMSVFALHARHLEQLSVSSVQPMSRLVVDRLLAHCPRLRSCVLEPVRATKPPPTVKGMFLSSRKTRHPSSRKHCIHCIRVVTFVLFIYHSCHAQCIQMLPRRPICSSWCAKNCCSTSAACGRAWSTPRRRWWTSKAKCYTSAAVGTIWLCSINNVNEQG